MSKEFFVAIQQWIDEGFPYQDGMFNSKVGLCSNANYFGIPEETTRSWFNEVCYPFNKNRDDYIKERNNNTLYQNPKRLAFIKSQLEK